MSVGTAAAIAIGVGAAGSIGSSLIGANASKSAAKTQANAANQAQQFQEQVYGDQQKNQAPYLAAGQTSIADLMKSIQNGTFGPGSIPQFQAPTLAQARATPGYQFTQQQGTQALDRSAAASGLVGSGAAAEAAERYGTGLADSTYNDTFNRSLATYGSQLQGQSQAFNQLLAPAQLGEGAVQSINNTGTQAASNIGNLMVGAGNATAAGTVGAANAYTSGLTGLSNSVNSGLLYNQFFGGGGLTKGYSPALTQNGQVPFSLAEDANKFVGSPG